MVQTPRLAAEDNDDDCHQIRRIGVVALLAVVIFGVGSWMWDRAELERRADGLFETSHEYLGHYDMTDGSIRRERNYDRDTFDSYSRDGVAERDRWTLGRAGGWSSILAKRVMLLVRVRSVLRPKAGMLFEPGGVTGPAEPTTSSKRCVARTGCCSSFSTLVIQRQVKESP
jgi:hypothetical protein